MAKMQGIGDEIYGEKIYPKKSIEETELSQT